MTEHQIALATLIVLFLTMCVLIWYTWETHKMQVKIANQVTVANKQIEESKNQTAAMIAQTTVASRQGALLERQIALSILPGFTYVYQDGPTRNTPHILNIGNGVALDVRIRSFETRFPSIGIPMKTTIVPMGSLQKGEKGYFRWQLDPPPALIPRPWPDIFAVMRDELNRGQVIIVEFQDIEGNRYCQPLSINQDRCVPGTVKPL